MNRFFNDPHLALVLGLLLTSMMIIVVGRTPLTTPNHDLIA
jgi:hypothetical protein